MEQNNKWTLCHTMGVLSGCDVVLTGADNLFVGLKYDTEFCDSPYVLYKGNVLNTYERKVIEAIGIPCVENKPLARELYVHVKESEQIPTAYWKVVAEIYSHLKKYEKPKDASEFEKEHDEDVQYHIYDLEASHYQKVIRNFKKQKTPGKAFKGNVAGYIEEEIRNLTADYELNTRSYHNTLLKTDEFYLETCFGKHDITFLQMIFVAEKEKQIYIGTRTLFMTFEFAQANSAVEFIRLLVKSSNEDLMKSTPIHCEEYDINPKSYEIALNSIKTIVDHQYKNSGKTYNLLHDTITVTLALKKEYSEKPRMYLILITYKEYLKKPDAFKDFIKNPKPKRGWNFWCKEMKYNPEYFDEKFQTVTT